jgi:hypothetical protein
MELCPSLSVLAGLGKASEEGLWGEIKDWVCMDGRYRVAMVVRSEGGASDVVKDRQDEEKAVAAKARQRVIGRELRRIYNEVVQEPVPEDFLVILRKIDEAEGKKDAKS